MEVRKVIHIFNGSGEIYTIGGWEIICHSNHDKLKIRDMKEGTNHYHTYLQLSDEYKEEFYKYVTLYYEGGIFARYGKVDDIPLKEIEELTNYCNTRQISLFQCPSAIIVGFVHHPQLMSMLSDENFHPLSNLFKKTENTVGYKTLVTSLPLGSYLDKIRVPVKTVTVEKIKPISAFDATSLGILSFTSVIFGITFGLFIGRNRKDYY